jgi:hypothetical protein
VSISRRKILQTRANMLAALRRDDLTDDLRRLAKKTLDHAEVVLGLQDALARRLQRDAEAQRDQEVEGKDHEEP